MWLSVYDILRMCSKFLALSDISVDKNLLEKA